MRAILLAIGLVLAAPALAEEAAPPDPAALRAQIVEFIASIETTVAGQDEQLAELLDRIDATEDPAMQRQLRGAADRMTASLDAMDETRAQLEAQLAQLDAIIAARQDEGIGE